MFYKPAELHRSGIFWKSMHHDDHTMLRYKLHKPTTYGEQLKHSMFLTSIMSQTFYTSIIMTVNTNYIREQKLKNLLQRVNFVCHVYKFLQGQFSSFLTLYRQCLIRNPERMILTAWTIIIVLYLTDYVIIKEVGDKIKALGYGLHLITVFS